MSKTKQRAPAKKKSARKQRAPRRPPSRQPAEKLYSINALSEELHVDRRTLKKHLSDITPARTVGRSKLYRIEDVRRVIEGSGCTKDSINLLRSEQIQQQTRETEARADLLEIERSEKRRELVPLSEVQAMMRDAFLPVRQRFLALPADVCNRVNPTDPQFDREALQHWVDESLRLVRDQLPKTAGAPKPSKTEGPVK